MDRKALVSRHNPAVDRPDKLSPFTVGNGEFAFTADFTGLQTFFHYYDDTSIPLGTQSQWGWHTIPGDEAFSLDQTFREYDTYGRPVYYASNQGNEAARWLRANPHRLHLGQVGFRIVKSDDSLLQISDISHIDQSLDLWQGIIRSAFTVEGETVQVETCCHPQYDQIAARIHSALIGKGRLGIVFNFPYGSLSWGKESADWNNPERHVSKVVHQEAQSAVIERSLDADRYFVEIEWKGRAGLDQVGPHSFVLLPQEADSFEFVCCFSPSQISQGLPHADETMEASATHWQDFWKTGGAIDLSQSTDPRAGELERRIVLSQYLMAVQCAGSMPPQETGLTCNSWHGKFHLEMHWWHAVHFALWGRPHLFEKSLGWYKSILPSAKHNARQQGYTGARWPKMVGPDGRESPSSVGVLLIWQQPHPIYYAELLYRINRDPVFLDEYKEIVFESAEFLASYAHWDEQNSRYVLGPPLIPAQEIYKAETTTNPAFELSYWAYGLETAQKWRERLGLARNEQWDHVLQNLSALPQNNGCYQNAETALNTFEDAFNRNDHPTLLGAYGMLPYENIDVEMMRRTLHRVLETWNWQRTWGWDYPMVAMTAARVGEPELAIDALLMDVPKNRYLNNGHNHQDDRLTLYLPGNGGLLTAAAMMAAGWDGSENKEAPGFPHDGKWVVKWEGLSPLP
ncbi:glycoside hydrolase family 65 [candidate division KSB1 bacterium RBG_16_48_16]|nr:MAG: glycoside hydrolase family 65 [candidate division KSB1 bacterium RBG_16_48_16]